MLKILSNVSNNKNEKKKSKFNGKNRKNNLNNNIDEPKKFRDIDSYINNIKKYKNKSYIINFMENSPKKKEEKNKNKELDIKNNYGKNYKTEDIKKINNIEKFEENKNNININNKINKDNKIRKDLDKIKEGSNNINLKINPIKNIDNNMDNNIDIINDNKKIEKAENKSIKLQNVLLKDKNFKDVKKTNIRNVKNNSLYNINNTKKNKSLLKKLNSSTDDIYNNKKKYLNIKTNCRNAQNSNNIYKQISVDYNNKRIKELSNKLSNILNLSNYNSLIKKRQLKKAGLQTSISNLESSIKLFKKNKNIKERECRKLSEENLKIMASHEITKDKIKNFDLVKQEVDMKNKEIQDLKEETNNIYIVSKQTQKEIDEMNINLQLLNKKISDELKICENIRKDITFYKKHIDNLLQKIKIFVQNSENVEKAIINLEENN